MSSFLVTNFVYVWPGIPHQSQSIISWWAVWRVWPEYKWMDWWSAIKCNETNLCRYLIVALEAFLFDLLISIDCNFSACLLCMNISMHFVTIPFQMKSQMRSGFCLMLLLTRYGLSPWTLLWMTTRCWHLLMVNVLVCLNRWDVPSFI